MCDEEGSFSSCLPSLRSGRVVATSSVEQLAELAEQRHRDPNVVLSRVREVLANDGPPDVVAAARWVTGLALHELGRVPEAVESYRLAVESSLEHGLRDIEAQARAGLAISLVSAGEAKEATEQITTARDVATASTQGVVEMLFGLVLQRTGHLAEAQATYSRALRRLQETGDATSIARLRLNRGILRAYRGDSRGAVEDLVASERLAAEQKLPVLTAMAAHNLGFAYGRRGDLPQALSAFGRAEDAYTAAAAPGSLPAVLQADRCEVLLLAGLVSEARQAAQTAVAAVANTSDVAYLTECRLLLARAFLAGGAYVDASRLASAVAEDFRSAGRLPWAALASYVAIQAEVLDHQEEVPPPGLLTRCRQVANELQRWDWRLEAGHVRTFVGRMALALHQPAVARAELASAVASRRRGTADVRAQSWYASALLCVAEGDRRGARQALSRGLRIVEEHMATLGATELRARAAGQGTELARLGVRLAIEQRRPGELFRWAERWRASSLQHPPIQPPDDDELVAALAELRRIRSAIREAALTGAATEQLEREAVSIEGAIRRRLLEVSGDAVVTQRFDAAEVRRLMQGRVLVEYVELEGRLYAVVVTRARSRLVELGPLASVEHEQSHLMFALRRSLRSGSRSGPDALVDTGARRLDQILIRPLGLEPGTPVIVVPTGILHGLPWGRLPTLAACDLTVAPSAALWARAATTTPTVGTGVLLVAGPGLPGAEEEVRQLGDLYPHARVLVGREATVSNVLEGLSSAGLVHLAAHGTFRADSPLFSSFLLADGPLTVHDLERVPRAASTVVLAACKAGVSGVIGDELIGTAATLLALGVRSIAAPVVSVPDASTARFMVALHRRLQAGLPMGAAMAQVRSGSEADVASVFLCLGRDDRTQQ